MSMSSAPLFRQTHARMAFGATGHLKHVPHDPSFCTKSTDVNIKQDLLFRSCPRGRYRCWMITARAMSWGRIRNHFIFMKAAHRRCRATCASALTGSHIDTVMLIIPVRGLIYLAHCRQDERWCSKLIWTLLFHGINLNNLSIALFAGCRGRCRSTNFMNCVCHQL